MSTTINTGVMNAPERSRRFAFPCSYAQSRLWFIDQLEPGSAAYNIPMAARLEGELNAKALERSLIEIVRRHEALRTTFRYIEDHPAQIVHEDLAFKLRFRDLRSLSPDVQQDQLQQLMRREEEEGFDLEQGPLLRGQLLR